MIIIPLVTSVVINIKSEQFKWLRKDNKRLTNGFLSYKQMPNEWLTHGQFTVFTWNEQF